MSTAPNVLSAGTRQRDFPTTPSDRDGALALVERVHTVVPGRARLRVRALYGTQSLARRLELALRTKPGVRTVTASTVTATVLVHFDNTCSLDDVVLALGVMTLHETARVEAVPQAFPSGGGRTKSVGTGAARRAHGPQVRTGSHTWHALGADQVLAELATAPRGLSAGAARERLRRFGPNSLPEPAARSPLAILLNQFCSTPVALLGASAFIAACTGGVADAAAIAMIVLINATIGFTTERRAERTIASLAGGVQRQALVLRQGKRQEVDAREIVPGEVVLLTPGAYVPADLRLLHARDVCVDESALTGESCPVVKQTGPLGDPELPLSARVNMAYMGTFVSTGEAIGIAVATGAATEIGTVQRLTAEARAPETPLQRELNGLGRQLVFAAGAICGFVFGIGVLRGLEVLAMLRAAISLGVAAVPEGLPTVATTSLALGVHRMRRQQALVRKLEAVETLGAIEVLCLDKTGTLTQNRMAVCEVYLAGVRLPVVGHRVIGLPAAPKGIISRGLERLLEIAVLCNETRISDDDPAHVLNGSATESALVELALGAGVDVAGVRRQHPLISIEYRAEGRNYMRTRHPDAAGGVLVAVKGSPAEVLEMCRWHTKGDSPAELSAESRKAILEENERMAGHGLRVLGFAYAEAPQAHAHAAPHLIWAGLAGMADPLREGVAALIQQLHQAGIRTVMLTGDQNGTARSIGETLRLAGSRDPQVLDSTHFHSLDPDHRSALAQQIDIYSRVSPAHKLQIVRALQQVGRVVAMTGDGINDGPALKAADIGIAMGRSGTDLARSAADVVLENDDLGTLISAMSQGRTTYSNIRKAIHFLLATNLSEIQLMLASIALGLGQPLSPIQLLWINLLSDVFPGLALSMEPPEPEVMKCPPRDAREPMVHRSDLAQYAREATIMTAGALGSYGIGLLRHGPGARAQTLSFMTLTLGQLAHAYACRSDSHGLFAPAKLPRNRLLDLAVAATAAAQFAALFFPGLRRLLGLARLDGVDLAVTAAGAVLPLLANEALKNSRRRAVATAPASLD